MNIEQEINSWDGKSSSDIGAIYSRYACEEGFVANLVVLCGRKELEQGATWLLKHHLEHKNTIEDREVSAIYNLASNLEHWQARLHILQSMAYMPVAEADKRKVENFLRDCLMDANKFVRAWAYNGFYELSVQFPEYKSEAKHFFDIAMRDEAPSVKARIRNIIKKGF